MTGAQWHELQRMIERGGSQLVFWEEVKEERQTTVRVITLVDKPASTRSDSYIEWTARWVDLPDTRPIWQPISGWRYVSSLEILTLAVPGPP